MKSGLFRLQYEVEPRYTEQGSEQGAKLDTAQVDDPEVRRFLDNTASMGYKQTFGYLKQKQLEYADSIVVTPFTTRTPEALAYRLEGKGLDLLGLLRDLALQVFLQILKLYGLADPPL